MKIVKTPLLRGTFTALVTPFKGDHIDEEALERACLFNLQTNLHEKKFWPAGVSLKDSSFHQLHSIPFSTEKKKIAPSLGSIAIRTAAWPSL